MSIPVVISRLPSSHGSFSTHVCICTVDFHPEDAGGGTFRQDLTLDRHLTLDTSVSPTNLTHEDLAARAHAAYGDLEGGGSGKEVGAAAAESAFLGSDYR